MKLNRAGLVALSVLVIATLLMVFFVLPRISGEPEAPKTVIVEPQKPEADPLPSITDLMIDTSPVQENVVDKVGRLAAEATVSITDLATKFDDNRFPTASDLSASRQTVNDKLLALQTVDIPDALDETSSKLLTTARAAAERTIKYLSEIPNDPQKAVSMVLRLAGIFAGTDDGAPRPDPIPEPIKAAEPEVVTEASEIVIPMPRFDVLRVEPDGSAVIAGKAAANSEIEIISNGEVIAKTKSEDSGDFVAVLDNPLASGAYEIILRAIEATGTTTLSIEVATISIPENKEGDLLAMVTTPGKPSRLLTVPTLEAPVQTTPTPTEPEQAASTEQPIQTAQDTETTAVSAAPVQEPLTSSGDTQAIQVSAVEFEGKKIFVAGTAPAATTIRALINEDNIGSSKSEASGSFVIEGEVELPVGKHVITAEVLDEAGNVTVRVRVPFERPEGNQVTVAKSAEPVEHASTATDRKFFEGLRSNVKTAFDLLKGLYADGNTPTLEEVLAAKSSNQIAIRILADFTTTATTNPNFTNFARGISEQAKSVYAMLEQIPNEVSDVKFALAGLEQRINALLVDEDTSTAVNDGGPKTIEQAPLAHDQNAVIIRRGDTLWQISRRVYGQGVRYTTIYLANQDQITNPDQIEPGQIFGVPDEALPNAEEIHRKRITGN